MAAKFIAYLRVSTQKQGQSGLGLEAQEKMVRSYVERVGGYIVSTHIEVESGKRHENRPKLLEAIDETEIHGGTLIIAKLDRLSRNAAFLLTLKETGVKFVAADMPTANDMMVGMMALQAQWEREMIAERTRSALAAKKARGALLGFASPDRPNSPSPAECSAMGKEARIAARRSSSRKKSNEEARRMKRYVDRIMAAGETSATGLARELNNLGIPAPRGGLWHPMTAARLMRKINAT